MDIRDIMPVQGGDGGISPPIDPDSGELPWGPWGYQWGGGLPSGGSDFIGSDGLIIGDDDEVDNFITGQDDDVDGFWTSPPDHSIEYDVSGDSDTTIEGDIPIIKADDLPLDDLRIVKWFGGNTHDWSRDGSPIKDWSRGDGWHIDGSPVKDWSLEGFGEVVMCYPVAPGFDFSRDGLPVPRKAWPTGGGGENIDEADGEGGIKFGGTGEGIWPPGIDWPPGDTIPGLPIQTVGGTGS